MKKKSLLRLVAAACSLLIGMSASAYDFMVDGLAYNFNGDGQSVTLTRGGTKKSGSLSIPATVAYDKKTYSVTIIDRSAFDYCYDFTGSLTIPNSVTEIGDDAFYYCSFTSLSIGNSVKSIGSDAFLLLDYWENAVRLHRVDISDLSAWLMIDFKTVHSNPLALADHLYLNGNEITNLVIPSNITEIKKYAFYGCSGFTGSLTIPNSVTTIGESAFSHCSGFTGSLTIGNSVKSIGDRAFYGCSGLTGSLTIPNSVATIGNYAFYGCNGLTGSLNIPNSVTTIGGSAFRECSGFTGSLTIGNSVTTIGDDAFEECSNLFSITLGESVKSLGNYSFAGCVNIADIFCKRNRPAEVSESSFPTSLYQKATVHVPSGSWQAYISAPIWMKFDNIVEESSIPQVKGDLNGDGIVDVTDVNMVIDIVLGKK